MIDKEEIIKRFDSYHRASLLYDPKENEALYFAGKMIGYRDTLKKLHIEISGVSDKWWFEHIEGPDFKGFLEEAKVVLNAVQLVAVKYGYKTGSQEIEKLIEV